MSGSRLIAVRWDGTPVYRQCPTTLDKLQFLNRHMTALNDWETGFVFNAIGLRQLSPKQIAVINRLFARVHAQRGRTA
jgi:hypothetical protein